MQKIFFERRKAHEDLIASGKWAPPNVAKMMKEMMAKASNLVVNPATYQSCIVQQPTSADQVRVDFNLDECTCGEFQEFKFPCAHAAACIKRCVKDLHPGEFGTDFKHVVDPVYTAEQMLYAYERPIYSVGNIILHNFV
jgi:hypothetical protein